MPPAMTLKPLVLPLLLALLPISAIAADTARYTAIFGGKNVGHVIAEREGDAAKVDYDVKNNGRGPTIAETLRFGKDGLPSEWRVTGTTTFGSKVDERFTRADGTAEWVDSTGKGHAYTKAASLYVAQSASPWALQIYADAILKQPSLSLPVLPGGTLRLEKGATLKVDGKGGPLEVTRYTLYGIETTPDTLLIDANGKLFANVSPAAIVVREGYEGEEVRLRGLAADWATERFVAILVDTGVSHGLIGPREVPRLWERHVLNCAVVEDAFPEGARVIDVGSGAGLPGLALAIARPDLEVLLVEPMLRRTTWLEGVVEELALPSVSVHRGRAEELARRAPEHPVAPPRAPRGYRKLYLQSVTQADQGVDFDFLQAPERRGRLPRT